MQVNYVHGLKVGGWVNCFYLQCMRDQSYSASGGVIIANSFAARCGLELLLKYAIALFNNSFALLGFPC